MGLGLFKDRRKIGTALIAIGSLIIVFVIAINVIDLVKSNIAINDFKKAQVQVAVEKINEDDVILPTDTAITVDEPESDVGEAMCLLRIPKIKLEEAVKEGSTRGVLSSALGHVENTAFPGEDGNCCIAGHRNYVFGKYFNRLDEMEVGDSIELETKENIYQYVVTAIEVVEPHEVRVLDYLEGQNLTLITCTPFMVGTHRLIVHAKIQ